MTAQSPTGIECMCLTSTPFGTLFLILQIAGQICIMRCWLDTWHMRGIEGSVKFIYGWSLPSKAMNTYSLQDHFRRDLPWGEKNFTSGISG